MGKSENKLGILGGCFDPVHAGHLMMAEAAADAFGLDKVIFVAANQPPFKNGGAAASARDRLAMVKAAIKGNPRLAVSDVEIKRGGVSYTVDTLDYFRKIYPAAELFLIIGGDNVAGLAGWKSIDSIRKFASFIVIERDWFDVSSTLIRQRIKQKKSIRYLTADGVIRYINRNRLYI
ncbi:MAG: nicotinate (nicotinamide) nucleotide adenylyltransferase [Candidatus Omnitrophica bacterium]|nr:nicotinate (nicotinamide) nucleotide adenylyltransferase [Candidatus Omnitrophota bacterium]